jgi:hypothetical protein
MNIRSNQQRQLHKQTFSLRWRWMSAEGSCFFVSLSPAT